jgi:hypothetical protein
MHLNIILVHHIILYRILGETLEKGSKFKILQKKIGIQIKIQINKIGKNRKEKQDRKK